MMEALPQPMAKSTQRDWTPGLETKPANAHNWKHLAPVEWRGLYDLRTEDSRDVPVRMFLTPRLLEDAEDILYRKIVTRLDSDRTDRPNANVEILDYGKQRGR